MKEKKNIDRLFQEKFKDFDVKPNAAVWEKINQSLSNPEEKKRRVIPLWWRVAGVAALLLLLISLGYGFLSSDNNDPINTPVVNNSEIKKNNTKPSQNNTFDESKIQTSNSNNTLKNHPNKALSESTSNQEKDNNSVVSNSKNNTFQNKIGIKKQNSSLTVSTKKESTNPIAIKKKVNIDEVKDNAVVSTKTKAEDNRSNTDNTTISELNNIEKEVAGVTEIKEETKTSKPSIEDAIAENTEETNTEEKETPIKRWALKPNVAPVYFGSFGEGSSIGSQFNENSKTADIQMSYGISGSYALSKRLKIRAGINKVDLNQITSNVIAFTNVTSEAREVGLQSSNINYMANSQNITLMSRNTVNTSSSPEIFNTKIPGNLEQRFGFIELPLELEYRLLDKSFGINVIGGFSTLFLNNNELYADVDGVSNLIGEANNINNTSFSANLGLGLDYSFTKNWQIHMEPIIKYQVNSFSDTTGNFNPFFFGIYTGFSFKF